ncbi:LacI family DNA-binding transcriptional regulator [Evansella sp. AB-rgal1]|uniref:LacI family DNA-binding transcriptional regulator n=1 Tax=Evansella sp. AB-rgal1 TaxID=3242696 RepID=UPI00359EE0C8
MKKKSITIYDIAKEANVSPSTVSRVLTGSAKVRPDTLKKVTEIMDKYHFQPNALARSLLYKQSKMIGFVITDITHSFYSTLVLKSEKHAVQQGYSSFLCNSMNDGEMESKYLQTLLEKQVDGILFLGGRTNETDVNPSYIKEMEQIMNRVPVVLINGDMPGLDSYVVRADEEEGVRRLIELIVNHGHTKIGFLGGVSGITSMTDKVKVYKETLAQHKKEVRDEWIIDSGFTIESGEEAALKLLNVKERPSAVVCVNDFVAIGAINMFSKFGLRVPDDISVVGFDDIPIAKHFPPGITTISQNYDELGQTAVDVLIDLIEGREAKKETVIPTKLMLRNSCWKYREN